MSWPYNQNGPDAFDVLESMYRAKEEGHANVLINAGRWRAAHRKDAVDAEYQHEMHYYDEWEDE